MSTVLLTARPRPLIPAFAVGFRVFTDRGLVRQIADALRCRTMSAAEIARLENVRPEVLLQIVESRLDPRYDASSELRAFARSHHGYSTAAWVKSRNRLSRRHIIGPSGAALCGTPLGEGRELLDGGPCHTCAVRASLVNASVALAA
jgi:hypothetical protein